MSPRHVLLAKGLIFREGICLMVVIQIRGADDLRSMFEVKLDVTSQPERPTEVTPPGERDPPAATGVDRIHRLLNSEVIFVKAITFGTVIKNRMFHTVKRRRHPSKATPRRARKATDGSGIDSTVR